MTKSYLYHSSKDRLPDHLGTGVSLHSHTSRSRETMSFIPRYVDKVPYMTGRIRHLEAKYREHHGQDFDYSRVWWTPPLEPKAAFDLEASQIGDKLGRPALVSLSDHDNVDAGFALEMFASASGAPISLEWTVPVENSFLHLGVHNLQPGRARLLEGALREATQAPSPDAIEDMLVELECDPATLIVLNHPLWDEARMGNDYHRRILNDFFTRHGHHIHALELNGLRCPRENAEVATLAAEKDLPLVGGGDRHGCEPNAILNLTRARTFAEFAAEIRDGAPTHTVYMPQYEEPLRVRVLQVMSDVLRTYDDFEASRRRWSDRIFFLCEDATVRRLSDVWTGNGPDIVGQFVAAMRLMESRHFRAVLKLTLAA